MIRFLLITFALTAIMAFAVIAARSIGSHYESPFVAAWKAYQCDPQPCWHSIRPGVTTIEQAASILKADQKLMVLYDPKAGIMRFRGPDVYDGDIESIKGLNVMGSIMLILPEGSSSTLADLVIRFGHPITGEVCDLGGNPTMQLFFDGSISAAVGLIQPDPSSSATFDNNQILNFTNSVAILNYNVPPALSTPTSDQTTYGIPWHGFTRVKTYPCSD